MERTGLTEHAATAAGKLSGGWRRLLDITRASLHQPDLLILDEPTVGLDPEHRDRVWSLLESQRRSRGTTILFSTHYLAEAESSDRVVLLSRGRVVANDLPAALRTTVGQEVAEIEGPGAERLVKALRGLGAVSSSLQTERGFRIGLKGSREAVVELAGSAPGIQRFALRPATLEDVYFARTKTEATAEPG
jgi:ABC-type multidrug transport system ATPase subunit